VDVEVRQIPAAQGNWEQLPDEARYEELDENLWFEATCPHDRVGYNVSLREMGNMSEQARYFIKGFLSGTEPEPPTDVDGNTTPEDLQAWRSATARFRRTGTWYGRWGTCDECGCVLLPDTTADFCNEHLPPA